MSIRRILASSILKSKSSKMVTVEQVAENNKKSVAIIDSLRKELAALSCEIIERKKQELRVAQANLQKQVEAAKNLLIAAELRNGKIQIGVPGARAFSTDQTQQLPVASAETNIVEEKKAKAEPKQANKEKKPKKEKPAGNVDSAATVEAAVDVGRLDMRVGKIVDVQRHPDADSLYLEKIDCGESQPRTVVSGLVKYVPIEEMQNRMVIVLCNLKPAKMRGVTSEAMVMCASTPEKVEVLSPPAGAVPGDLVQCEGYTRQPDAQLNPKKKIFETCAPDLMTNNQLVACYKNAVLHVPGKGNIVAQTLKNVNVK